ncbi:nuclear transport factor 2 family protein [Paraburkholderia ferrariae]|uniref:nuclear transport factor 2 family protein n=1 Tax=Paraburkholderia ferrariae TaxID=386056 RepID=UPI001FE05E2A|nr:nuclear transport factor 2 family protein [Paraburkholderia ferrariae]
MKPAPMVLHDPTACDVVQAFWRLMSTNDFHAVEAVLARDFVLEWPQSNERIRGATNFARLNTAYPAQGPWVFTINRLVANENEVVSDVGVTDGFLIARAISFFTIEQGKITRMVEFWPEPYEAPFDRTAFVEPIHPAI